MKIFKKIFLTIFFIFIFIILFSLYKFSFAFEIVDNTGNSSTTYNIPDVSSNYQHYLTDNPYFIHKYSTYYNIIVLADDSSYFYINGDNIYISGKFYQFRYNGGWEYSPKRDGSGYAWDYSQIIYYNTDVYSNINKTSYFFKMPVEPEYIFPYIADTDEVLANLDNIDDILVFPGSLSKDFLPLKLSIYKYIDNTTVKGVLELSLDTSSPYYLYIIENPDDYWWEIPTELFKHSLENGQEYHFSLLGANEYNDFSILRSITYQGTTYVPPTDEELQTDAIINQTQKIEEQTDAIKDQTEKIEEQTEVNKSIFARIGEILSYINPLSENFFAYKLIDLLIDALKSLFVPEEGFLGSYFDELFDWFCDRLGFLSYPLELILDILDKILNINFAEPIINIPEIKESFTNLTLISANSFNFNTLLENDTLKNIHDIYLILVDAVIVFGFVNLLKRKMEEVTTL